MKILDLVAILGALAWSPHLIALIKHIIIKAKVRVITHREAEIGFTTHGPIFNMRLAFSVSHKDIVLSDLKIRVKHESGEEKLFEWQGITQQVGRMTMPDSAVMPFEKEQSVLAVKLNQKEIEERSIRCQEISFIANKQALETSAIAKLAYLKAEKKYDPEEFLRSQEMIDLYNFNKQAFSWKSGLYTMCIEIGSPEKFDLVDPERSFVLNPIDIEKLRQNVEQLELGYKHMLITPESKADEIVWQWCYPALRKM
jgi:hypothetical protein